MQKLIIDTDPGIDDAMALLFAEAAADIDLLGITTVFGNAALATTTRNALYLAERFDFAAPVFRGAATPLQGATQPPPAAIHGADGLGNIEPGAPRREVSSLDAAAFIADTVLRYPGAVTLLTLGSLTNLAQALALQPAIVDAVCEVVVMGGALGTDGHHGNVVAHAEANIHADPHAAEAVFAAPWPVTMVGLDVSMQVLVCEDFIERLRVTAGDAGQFIRDISRCYQAFYREQQAMDCFPMHDASALACVLDPSLFNRAHGTIRVITDGAERGRTLQSTGTGDAAGRPVQRACVGVDAEGVLALYERTLRQGFGDAGN